MHITVECYAGYRGAEEPRAFTMGQHRLVVSAIQDRWLEPDHRYFKVTANDGNTYILRYDAESGEWALGAFRRGIEGPTEELMPEQR